MSISSRFPLLGLALAVCCLASCRHQVSYSLSQEGRVLSRHFPGTLRVLQFKDASPKHASINLTVSGESWKTNAPDIYRNKEYVKGISRMVAEDLGATGMFDRVLAYDELPGTSRGGFSVHAPSDVTTDYVLLGTVWDYSGVGRWKKIPENIVIFSSVLGSLPGALMAAGGTAYVKSDVVTNVILTDLRILNVSTGKVIWSGPPLRAGGVETVRWSKADPVQLAKRTDERLQEVVTQLIARLQRDLPKNLRP